MPTKKPFWEKPLASLDRGEWEALCDGCGRCCLHKAEDEDTGAYYVSNIACKLLDRHSGRCMDYPRRKQFVPDCTQLTKANLARIDWLPDSCAYRLRAEGKPLYDWHYLISGSRETVHEAGHSVRGWTVAESEAGPIEHHLVDRPL